MQVDYGEFFFMQGVAFFDTARVCSGVGVGTLCIPLQGASGACASIPASALGLICGDEIQIKATHQSSPPQVPIPKA